MLADRCYGRGLLISLPPLRIAERDFARDPRPALVRRLGNGLIVPAAQLAARPVVVTSFYLHQLQQLSRILDIALRAIVARYFVDERIRAIYALPPAMEELLRLTADSAAPYRIGFYRPDFVYDAADGQPRLCEIGARYPLNGWMLSQAAAEIYEPYVTEMGWAVQAGQRGLLDDLCARYRPGERVAMVHEGEAGTEIFLLVQALRERGVNFIQAHPAALTVNGGQLEAGGCKIDHCILEMDRSELPLIPAPALRHLLATGTYFNDIRTLILIHDKRTLAVLWHEPVMRDILSPEDMAALRPFLIPSWSIDSPAACEALLAREGDMIVKRSSGGRGVDALVRSDCGEGAWRLRLRTDLARDMYQDYLAQYEFHVPGELRPVHLVGMHLCHDAISYGAGVFRGASGKIINVHGRRGHVHVPVITP
jgi:hypothetical protein